MKEYETILVIVHNQDDGEIVIQKAAMLAKACGAKLHVGKVVYQGFVDLTVQEVADRQTLKTQILAAEEAFLTDLTDPVREAGLLITSSVVWHKHAFEGILDLAATVSANLIVKSTNFPITEVIRTPQDWNLLRHSPVPVMLVKPMNWQKTPKIVAAVDTSEAQQQDLNLRIAKQAGELSDALSGTLHFAEVFPHVEQWVGPITITIDFKQIRNRLRSEITARLEHLAADCGVNSRGLLIEEGEPEEALQLMMSEHQADVLVLGTVQRKGVTGMLLGNTSEAILHTVNSDVLVVT